MKITSCGASILGARQNRMRKFDELTWFFSGWCQAALALSIDNVRFWQILL
jgi:hypothetical protein